MMPPPKNKSQSGPRGSSIATRPRAKSIPTPQSVPSFYKESAIKEMHSILLPESESQQGSPVDNEKRGDEYKEYEEYDGEDGLVEVRPFDYTQLQQQQHHHDYEESEISSDEESVMTELSPGGGGGGDSEGEMSAGSGSSIESLDADRVERRYLIDKHSFLHLKDPGLEIALLPEEKPPEKVYRGRKAERHKYQKLCDELGVQPLKAFVENMRSEVLDLRNYGLGEKDIVAICKVLADNHHIDTLLLSGNFAGESGGEAIAQMIQTNTRITHLDIGSMMIQPAMKKICDAVKINTVLESINFSINELTDSEMSYIAEVLLENITIRELFLQHNKITDVGLGKLAKGFVKPRTRKSTTTTTATVTTAEPNETIALMDLGWNRIKGEQDAGPFFEAIAKHPNIKFFNIAGNSLNNANGVSRILSRNKNLEVMSIAYNRLPEKSCPIIGKALAFTQAPLKHFIVGPNLWRQRAASQIILPLTAPSSIVPLETLDMSMGMCVGRKFLKSKRKVWKVKPELQILHTGSSYGVTKIHPVDGQIVTIKRAKTVCENFGTPLEMLIDELRTEPKSMTQNEFNKFIKSCDLYKDRVLTETFFKYFPKGQSNVDCEAIISMYDKIFPKAGVKGKKMMSPEELDLEGEEEDEAEEDEKGEGEEGEENGRVKRTA